MRRILGHDTSVFENARYQLNGMCILYTVKLRVYILHMFRCWIREYDGIWLHDKSAKLNIVNVLRIVYFRSIKCSWIRQFQRRPYFASAWRHQAINRCNDDSSPIWCISAHFSSNTYLWKINTWKQLHLKTMPVTCQVSQNTGEKRVIVNLSTLKRKCRHFDEILITGCTGSCHFDNFQCSQWWKFHQNEDISVSVHAAPVLRMT